MLPEKPKNGQIKALFKEKDALTSSLIGFYSAIQRTDKALVRQV